jgi:phage FluMu protein gp41
MSHVTRIKTDLTNNHLPLMHSTMKSLGLVQRFNKNGTPKKEYRYYGQSTAKADLVFGLEGQPDSLEIGWKLGENGKWELDLDNYTSMTGSIIDAIGINGSKLLQAIGEARAMADAATVGLDMLNRSVLANGDIAIELTPSVARQMIQATNPLY